MKLSKINHYREYIIAAVILIGLIIFGSIKDFDISKQLYNATETSWFGIIGSGIAELPVIVALTVGGIGMILGRIKKNKATEVICIILGVLAVLFALYYAYDTFTDIAEFERTKDYKTLITILAIVFSIIFVGAISALMIIFRKRFDLKTLFSVSLGLILMALIVAVVANVLKFMASRPRPKYIFTLENPQDNFKNWWEWNFLYSLKNGDDFKSWPSGHSSYAMVGTFTFPMLTLLFPKTKDNKLLKVVLFYVGLVWGIVFAISRVFAGAHFMTDISFGLLISLISSILGYLVADLFLKKIIFKQKEENK